MYPRHCSLFDCGGTSVICIGRLRWLRFACALVVTLGARQHRLPPLASISTGKVTCRSLWVSTLRVHFMSSNMSVCRAVSVNCTSTRWLIRRGTIRCSRFLLWSWSLPIQGYSCHTVLCFQCRRGGHTEMVRFIWCERKFHNRDKIYYFPHGDTAGEDHFPVTGSVMCK